MEISDDANLKKKNNENVSLSQFPFITLYKQNLKSLVNDNDLPFLIMLLCVMITSDVVSGDLVLIGHKLVTGKRLK